MTLAERFDRLPPTARRWAPYALLGFAVFLAYANVYNNDFLFDDELIITRNSLLLSWDTFFRLFTSSTTAGAHIAGGFYRPIQILLYFFVYQIAGPSPPAFHLLNVTLHAANACLLFRLGQKLNFNLIAVFLAALLWAVHPIHTEAVTYMSATADLLFGFFSLLCCDILLPDCSPAKVILALPVFVLGLLSKETSVVIPALAISCLFLTHAKTFDAKAFTRACLRTWPLWIIGGIYMFWRLGSEDFDGPRRYKHLFLLPDFATLGVYANHFSYRLYTFFATLPAYAELLLWPAGLHMERTFTIYGGMLHAAVIGGMIMTLAAVAQIIWGRGRRGVALSWGLVWFAIAHFPDSGIMVPVNSLFLEHWMYVPMAGLSLAIAQSIWLGTQKLKNKNVQPILAGLCLIAAVALTGRTLDQNTVWHDPVSFYTNIFKFGVTSARAHNNLALAYIDRRKIPEALDEFKKAMAITDTYAETRHNYALALLRLPDQDAHLPEVIENLNRAITIDPHFYRSYQALAAIYDHLGDTAKAEDARQKAAAAQAYLEAQ